MEEIKKEEQKPEENSFAWVLIEQSKAQTKHAKVLTYIIAGLLVLSICGNIGQAIYSIYAWQSYEYVSQDGQGINNINSGSQGDLTSGTESENKEEW